ncbi:ectonucleotide pyrophosphatase/phosphodiesterase family member 3-like [Tachysurus fulvidraco]|uniref:ectonucleotide pyrophosphatase/phosphodiesterase family member 3-like n=1 Tax=Tachysurus fulvidraco TaxID=1234273 RepID=UPI001FEFCC7A|nr:ectonucleotide pyrophosphatase/phosphodiesterase family member 3-like [Tachysurus fulvidraco]
MELSQIYMRNIMDQFPLSRVFTVLQWLQLPDDQRPDFYTLYLEEPDKSGHSFGPVSGGLISAIQGVDNVIGQLMNGLKQLDLHECINIIVVADHVDAEGLVAKLTCQKPDQKIKPYLKAHLPKRFHYAHSRCIEDVNVLVESLWLFERYPGSLHFCSGGNHGYDNDDPNMQAMFLSYSPTFIFQTEVEPFSNLELYNLMCGEFCFINVQPCNSRFHILFIGCLSGRMNIGVLVNIFTANFYDTNYL